jgi:alcohol dehydrogenase (NADP+)
MGDFLGLLVTGGTLVELGMPGHPLEVPAFPLAAGRLSIAGSLMGGIPETQEMLDFCAEHDVTTEIEVIAPDYINDAYERVLSSEVRYRFVIDTASLR